MNQRVRDKSIVRFRKVIGIAYDRLEERRQEINDLNVFPVADGDTGNNMSLTMQAVLGALDELEQVEDDPDRTEIVETVARAALMGARGNSGVILSQIVRGAAEKLATPKGRLIDPDLISDALSNAARVAREAIPNPAPGTMLTAIDAMAEGVSRQSSWREHRLGGDASPVEQNLLLAGLIETALEEGIKAVRDSTDQLEQLADAGVVDAGALGLVVIIRGAIEGLIGSGDALPEIPHYEAARIERAHEKGSKYRYCTNFVVHAHGLVPADWVRRLEELGDSVLVVADRSALKVHVHTDDDRAAFALFDGVGRVEVQEVTDMREQIAARVAAAADRAAVPAPPGGRCGGLAVVAGDGIAGLLVREGVTVLDGGPTLNPSTKEILAAIDTHPADEVIVLPNSKNVVLAAEQAAELSGKQVIVIDCLSQQAAVMAAIEIDTARSAEENAAKLAEVLGEIRVGAVAPAARDDAEGRFVKGEAVGFVGDEPVAWGDPAGALKEVASRLAEGAEVLTVLRGNDAPPLSQDLGLNGEIEVEIHDGGQPAYWWLLAAQ